MAFLLWALIIWAELHLRTLSLVCWFAGMQANIAESFARLYKIDLSNFGSLQFFLLEMVHTVLLYEILRYESYNLFDKDIFNFKL